MSAPDGDAPWTVARLLAWTRGFLQDRGVESPRLCAEVLLADAMGCERLRLFTQHEAVPPAGVLDAFRARVREAAAGKPIAYIVGRKDFFSLTFEVDENVLIPRPETEILVERVIALVRARRSDASPLRILDLGCGSGCIAVSLARHLPGAQLCASDASEAAVAVARRNADRLGVNTRIDFRVGDLLTPWAEADAPFDIIVSNPPYIADTAIDTVAKNVREFEPHAALFAGPDGLAVIRPLVAQAPKHLAGDGHLLLEVAAGQASRVRALFAATDWPEIQTYSDGGGHERVVHARRTRAAAPAAALHHEEVA